MDGPLRKRGVLYVVWNRGRSPRHDLALERSIQSLHDVHAELEVMVQELPSSAHLVDKAGMYEWTPFEETLFLDIDTVVVDRLDYGFEKAARHDIALTIAPAPYARRHRQAINGDQIEYNTGVIFWRKSSSAERVFREWDRFARRDGLEAMRAHTGPGSWFCSDQPSFARAVDSLEFSPFVLPANWNFRPRWTQSFFGPLKVWHDYADLPVELKSASNAMRSPNPMRFVQVRPL